MMKVQSFRIFETLDEALHNTPARVVPMFRSKRRSHRSLIIDGPFAETKESCSHVAILAHRRTKTDASGE
jgi:hypothetical protein